MDASQHSAASAAAAGAAPPPQPASYMEEDERRATLFGLSQLFVGLSHFRPDTYVASWILDTQAVFTQARSYPIVQLRPELMDQQSTIWMKFKQALTMPNFVIPGFR